MKVDLSKFEQNIEISGGNNAFKKTKPLICFSVKLIWLKDLKWVIGFTIFTDFDY